MLFVTAFAIDKWKVYVLTRYLFLFKIYVHFCFIYVVIHKYPKKDAQSRNKWRKRKKLVPWGTDGRLPLSDLDLDLDLGSGHTAYRRASLIDLYLRTKFH